MYTIKQSVSVRIARFEWTDCLDFWQSHGQSQKSQNERDLDVKLLRDIRRNSLFFGCLVVWNISYFPIYWESHHPNWRTHIFQRGGLTTNQFVTTYQTGENRPPVHSTWDNRGEWGPNFSQRWAQTCGVTCRRRAAPDWFGREMASIRCGFTVMGPMSVNFLLTKSAIFVAPKAKICEGLAENMLSQKCVRQHCSHLMTIKTGGSFPVLDHGPSAGLSEKKLMLSAYCS